MADWRDHRPPLNQAEIDSLLKLDEDRDGGPKLTNPERIAVQAGEIERLRKLVQDLIDNDPNEIISDAGHSLLDLWRHDARKALGPQVEGDR